MIRVTKITDYGVGLMAHLAGQQAGFLATAPDLAEDLQLPLPTVRKILKILARESLLVSQRGVNGGYSLAKPPREITLMDMVVALEGPMALTECATGEPCGCEREDVCNLRENWSWVNGLLQGTLKRYTLDQMAGGMPPWHSPNNNLQGLS
jgi:FeS assembly SUF system regulator